MGQWNSEQPCLKVHIIFIILWEGLEYIVVVHHNFLKPKKSNATRNDEQNSQRYRYTNHRIQILNSFCLPFLCFLTAAKPFGLKGVVVEIITPYF